MAEQIQSYGKTKVVKLLLALALGVVAVTTANAVEVMNGLSTQNGLATSNGAFLGDGNSRDDAHSALTALGSRPLARGSQSVEAPTANLPDER